MLSLLIHGELPSLFLYYQNPVQHTVKHDLSGSVTFEYVMNGTTVVVCSVGPVLFKNNLLLVTTTG